MSAGRPFQVVLACRTKVRRSSCGWSNDLYWQIPELQTPLMQSLPALHILPDAHAAHVPPPQSMSVSFPFLTMSVQVARAHVPALQTPLMQSVST
jgi:hypothetical protein